jgi:hypothetical protein
MKRMLVTTLDALVLSAGADPTAARELVTDRPDRTR